MLMLSCWEWCQSDSSAISYISLLCRSVCALGVWGYCRLKIVLHSLVQWGEVQSGWEVTISSSSSRGTDVGEAWAWKYALLFQDNASAIMLWDPLIWAADTTKLYFAIINERQRIRCIRVFSLLEPELISATTAELSDQKRTDFPSHSCPQRAADVTIGIISLIEMCEAFIVCGHLNCSHLLPS